MHDTVPETAHRFLSVLVPTAGRPKALARLMERLTAQTLDPEEFEVVVVDDGGEPRAELDAARFPFHAVCVRQPNAGPGAARNTGLQLCRGPLVLILNDDAVPANDLLESHLRAHEELGAGRAVLGTFRFTENARRSPFTRLLDDSDLLFTQSALKDGARLGWPFFWTCNISVAKQSIDAVGGFDARRFDRALFEDVELGFRLGRAGVGVVYREDCVAEHEHVLTPAGYMERAFHLGRYRVRMEEKHGLKGIALPADENERREASETAVTRIEQGIAAAEGFTGLLNEMEVEFAEREIPAALASDAIAALPSHAQVFTLAGIHMERTGADVLSFIENGPPSGTRVSIVAISCNAIDHTQRCVEALRAAADGRFPQEILFVDNGSTDGSAAWLREQPDVTLIQNPSNYGAPRARNQAIRQATGDWIAFLDGDVFVTKNWLERALYHGAADPGVGSVSLCAARASKKQVVPYDGPDDSESIDAFADRHYRSAPRQGVDQTLFTSFGVLVKREVIERIGGFDERFSPWGFEDDDFSLRIRLAGWRNRVARDVYVHHAEYHSADKSARHAALLQENWTAFLEKWSPTSVGAPLFDYDGIRLPSVGAATEAQIVFDLPAPDSPSPMHEDCPPAQDVRGPATDLSGRVVVCSVSASAGELEAHALGGASDARERATSEVRAINEYLLAGRSLASHGGLWLGDPSAIPLHSFDDELKQRAERALALEPGTWRPVADARFLVTLPAWREAFPDLVSVFVPATPDALLRELDDAARTIPGWDALELDENLATGLWARAARAALEWPSDTTIFRAGLEVESGPAHVRSLAQELRRRAGLEPACAAPRAETPEVSVVLWTGDASEVESRAALSALRHQSITSDAVEILVATSGERPAAVSAEVARARGPLVLFVDADRGVPAFDLVERHLAAHVAAGPGRAVLGAVERTQTALENALCRVLERTPFRSGTVGLDPEGLHGWEEFRTHNLSAPLEALRQVGLFNGRFDERAAQDADLGFRLQGTEGLRVVFEPNARLECAEAPTLDAFREAIVSGARSMVQFFEAHPKALVSPGHRDRLDATLVAHEEWIASTLEARGHLEASAREYADVNLAALERSSDEGAEIAEVLALSLSESIIELESLYCAIGEAAGFRRTGSSGFGEFLERSTSESRGSMERATSQA